MKNVINDRRRRNVKTSVRNYRCKGRRVKDDRYELNTRQPHVAGVGCKIRKRRRTLEYNRRRTATSGPTFDNNTRGVKQATEKNARRNEVSYCVTLVTTRRLTRLRVSYAT
jgi:hypothetical protein